MNGQVPTRKESLKRTELLLGASMMERLSQTRVIVIGVGGVGSWCAESLIRCGIGHLTIVDSDRVCASNINRQLMATSRTVGQMKVEVLRERLHEIQPEAHIEAIPGVFSAETAESFALDGYDYIIDCIDSLRDKICLIETACRTRATFFSSMGAAAKIDPTRIRTAEFWEVKGDPLARMIRKRMRKEGRLPAHAFTCVYSEELLENRGTDDISEETHRHINGTTAHITAIFGNTLAGLVLRDLYQKPMP